MKQLFEMTTEEVTKRVALIITITCCLVAVALSVALPIRYYYRVCPEDFYGDCLEAVQGAGFICEAGDVDYDALNITMFGDIVDEYMEKTAPTAEVRRSLRDYAEEYNAEIRRIYKYNLSNRYNRLLSQKQLEAEGGVCSHYAKSYAKKARADDLLADTCVFRVGDEIHEIAIIAEKEEAEWNDYCILDQELIIGCASLQ